MTKKTQRPLVTFIVIAYNQERYIREAIKGAFAQTYEPLEIILSDDCSSDRTYEIMQEMAAGYEGPHKVLLSRNTPNLGLIPHIDRVMELVAGDFIVVNAGDDVSVPKRTSALVAAWLASERRHKLLHSAVERIDLDGEPIDIKRPPAFMQGAPDTFEIVRNNGHIIGATAGWDKSIFTEFGPLGEGITAEDRIIPIRASIIGGLTYIPEELVRYRIGGVSAPIVQRSPAHEYLYGLSHKVRKWKSEVDFYLLERFCDLDYSRKDEVEAICRSRGRVLRFAVDLAETGRFDRWLMAPKALLLAWRHRTSAPVKDWARYTFENTYKWYANMRYASSYRRRSPNAGARASKE
ncbi:glycosyltransferase [Aestuariivita boseongensis]|uniref:glycosyltransferase n=1 Tax=Aestuariivita boseongensis TaxID=1470562 RepID=UPI000682A0B5|nr:glycosyltransferase [Aestuariivita boseongensis]